MNNNSDPSPKRDFQPIGSKSESVYEMVVREMADTVFVIDVEQTDGDYTFTFRRNNASHQQLTGLSEDAMRGQTPRELLGDEQGATVTANYHRCIEQGETIEYEERLELPAGTSYWQTKLTPVTDGEEVTQIVGVAQDITGQKQQEQKIQRLNNRFETILETMSAAVFLKDTDGQYLLMNRACQELLDVDDEDYVGLTDEDIFPPEIAKKAREDDEQVIENGKMVELEEEVPAATGNTVRLTRKSPVYGENGEIEGLCGVSTDITEQKRQEQEVTRLKDQFELAVEGAKLGLWDWDRTTDTVEFNEQWARMLGHSLDEIEPQLEEWKQRVHPDDLDTVEEVLDEHIAGKRERYDVEHRMQTADGGWKWIRSIGRVAERDEDSEPVRITGIHVDITEPKEYERTLEKQRDNLEVLSQIVRHDIRNQLQLILGYGDLLEEHVQVNAEEHLQRVLEAGREAVEITQTAGNLTKVMLSPETGVSSVYLRPVLEEQIENVRESYKRILITTEGELPDTSVLADDMLESVFRNLLNNAIVHNDKRLRKVTISATTHEEVVRVRIADNGPGIPDQKKDQIFEEGEKGLDSEGTGIGLYLVQTLVDRSGGAVWVEDNDPEGSVFIVELRNEQ